ncbi:glycosyltransferase [Peribacillus saganii]|uniref:Glycosyltransferase n=1 Tax=Peribacillus saganii TaxID=2303992 RepID=A0A372LER0_9BACI|nr:glycosyltransferase [Peribacillus saganii]RFU64423.1 glycosyltransferase [Peribacillus saganii]
MSVNVSEKVTAIIKTFERPHCLDLLIKSIKEFYPSLPIIVADDSKSPIPRTDVEYHVLPFDGGLSKGRNFLVKQVKTPYFLLLDDDHFFINETKIESLLDVLENSDIDIVGGRYIQTNGVRNSQAVFEIKNNELILKAAPYGKEGEVELYDNVANFFLAKTDKLQNHIWDERLKLGEHWDFFLSHKGNLKVAMHPEIFLFHTNDRSNGEYNEYRNREYEFYRQMFMTKHGILDIKSEQKRSPIKDVKKYLSSETIETYFSDLIQGVEMAGDFKSISVNRRKGEKVEIVHNPTSYPLVGRGKQGAVFKISSDKCVKIYPKKRNALNESEVLKAAQDSPVVPKLYEAGENYIVMEYIEGSSLYEYLKANRVLTEKITNQILFLLKEMKRLKFTRLDARLNHIYVTNQGELKVIDLVTHFKKKVDRPEILMEHLKRLGLLSSFLKQVKNIDPQSYQEWK